MHTTTWGGDSLHRKRPPGGKYGVKQVRGRSPPRTQRSAGRVASLSRDCEGRGQGTGSSDRVTAPRCGRGLPWLQSGGAPNVA